MCPYCKVELVKLPEPIVTYGQVCRGTAVLKHLCFRCPNCKLLFETEPNVT